MISFQVSSKQHKFLFHYYYIIPFKDLLSFSFILETNEVKCLTDKKVFHFYYYFLRKSCSSSLFLSPHSSIHNFLRNSIDNGIFLILEGKLFLSNIYFVLFDLTNKIKLFFFLAFIDGLFFKKSG
jgi:hypothetical protein